MNLNGMLTETRNQSSLSALIVQLIFCIVFLVYSMNAIAAGVCKSDKSDIAEDMQKINEKLSVKYGSFDFQKSTHIQTNYEVLEKSMMNRSLKLTALCHF